MQHLILTMLRPPHPRPRSPQGGKRRVIQGTHFPRTNSLLAPLGEEGPGVRGYRGLRPVA